MRMSKQVQRNQVVSLPGSKALWLVTEAQWGGGGTAHGPHDIYPDAWQVTVARLNPDTSLPTKSTRQFNQMTTCYSNTLHEVEVVGTWKPVSARITKAILR